MDTYYRRTPPQDLTILEQIEWETWAAQVAQKTTTARTLAHYSVMEKESRKLALHVFFTELERPDSDPSYLAERENELGITPEEWAARRAEKEARYAEDKF